MNPGPITQPAPGAGLPEVMRGLLDAIVQEADCDNRVSRRALAHWTDAAEKLLAESAPVAFERQVISKALYTGEQP